MGPPIFFLSFANDPSNPLDQLTLESEDIYRVLTPAANQQRIQIHREPFATIDNTAHYLRESMNRVVVFHYAGHANNRQLIFLDQSAAANGIANLLALQSSLKLVFLNGCSTREQVDLLLHLGIPAVIATSVPVQDRSAREFAQDFYGAVASNLSIKKAFQMAAAVYEARTGGSKPEIHRGVGRVGGESNQVLPWGLYVSDEGKIEHKLLPKISAQYEDGPYPKDLSLNKLRVLENSMTIATPLEKYIYILLQLMTEEEARITNTIYNLILQREWHEVRRLHELLEHQVSDIDIAELNEVLSAIKYNLSSIKSIAVKLRALIPFIPHVISNTKDRHNDLVSKIWHQAESLVNE